jgi:pimeloyl-ACP methyl ester carboxylesterase
METHLPDTHRPTIVLVHGAFADTSSWAKLIPLLFAKGFSVVAAHCPLSSLSDDVAAVKRVIGTQEGPVLLVGHSWGGTIITEAGNDAKVSGLVYIAAAAPDSNESFNDWWASSPAAPGAGEIVPYGPGGYVALTLAGVRDHFVQDLAYDEVVLVHATQGPFNQGANNEKITTAAWRSKPTWFVIGKEDHMLVLDLERATAAKVGAKILELPTSHFPMLSQPYAVADFIETAAVELGSVG